MSIDTKAFQSVNGRKVVLTLERLDHILQRHIELRQMGSDLVGFIGKTVEAPDFVILGARIEHIAIRRIGETKYHFIVPYDEEQAK